MRWIYPLFWVSVVLGVISLTVMSVFPFLIIFSLMFWLVMGNSVRCPRCLGHVLDTGRGQAPGIEIPESCVGCGRDKRDVWPFQWLLRRERV